MPGPPLFDFSTLGEIGNSYFQGQDRQRQQAFRNALAQLPTGPDGTFDYNAAVKLAAQYGDRDAMTSFLGGARSEAQLRQSQSSLAETTRHHKAVEDQGFRPTIIKGDVDPLSGGEPPIYEVAPGRGGMPGTARRISPGGSPAVPPAAASGVPPAAVPLGGELGPATPGAPPSVPNAQMFTPQSIAQAQPAAGPRGPVAPTTAPVAAAEDEPYRYASPPGPFNEKALEGLPPAVAEKIRAAARYEYNPRTSSTRGGFREAFTNKLYEYSPSYQEPFYGTKQQTMNAFSKGVEARVLRSVNNLTDHLDTARDLLTALDNGDVQAFNAIKNKFREQFGAEPPANVRAAAPIIAGEIMKVVAGSGAGGVSERLETAGHAMSTATSPKQAMGIMNTITALMAAQVKALEQQYETGTKLTDFRRKLSKGAKQVLERSEAGAHGGGVPGEAVQILRSNPASAAKFDARFGTPQDPNPSRRYIGGQ